MYRGTPVVAALALLINITGVDAHAAERRLALTVSDFAHANVSALKNMTNAASTPHTPMPPSPQTAKNAVFSWSDDWLQINKPPAQGVSVSLWATFYFVHRAQSIPIGQPLLDLSGNRLGPVLSQRDWCYAALQGTVLVEHGGQATTYNFAGRGRSPQSDCAPFLAQLSLEAIARANRVRFQAAAGPYGDGTAGFRLVPYRTIAVDRTEIPIGSVVFIAAARGRRIVLPSGRSVIHDGYFFAADVGSVIQGQHIDVFVGTTEKNPFPFITGRAGGTLPAVLIQDAEISQALSRLHRSF